MKWFHHDTAASQDPNMQLLGTTHGATGIGIYWGILEYIGYHSETFRLKVSGLSSEVDKQFKHDFPDQDSHGEVQQGYPRRPEKVPEIQLSILATILFTSRRKLKRVIRTCAQTGLLDEKMWTRYAVLHSPALESGADTYTQRRKQLRQRQCGSARRATSDVQTVFEQSQENVHTLSDKVPLEQEREEEREKVTCAPPVSMGSILQSLKLCTQYSSEAGESRTSPFKPSANEFREYCVKLRSILLKWNSTHTRRFEWAPTDEELKRLFYSGTEREKEAICYESMNVLGGELSYPKVVLRAVRLMLEASTQTRIVNPMAWLWTCLHGNRKGKGPWAQLMSAREEARGP